MTRHLGIIAIAIMLGACGAATEQDNNSAKKVERSAVGDKADGFYNPNLSCDGACGWVVQDETGYCGCDDLCTEMGDCCTDKAEICDGAEADVIVIDKSKDGETVTIKVGDKIDVQLYGNPSTGYDWKLLASSRSFPLQKEEFVPEVPQLAGAGGTFHFYFTADMFSLNNRFELQFAYYRVWDEAEDAIETFSVTVAVQNACPEVMCALYCENGFELGEDGCPICVCKELDSCGGIAGLSCPDGFFCKMDDVFPDAMGTCVSEAELKVACQDIDEDYKALVAQSQGCSDDSDCQVFVGGTLTCGHPTMAINPDAKDDLQTIADKSFASQCYKLDWNCPMFSPLPPWYMTTGVCDQGSCSVNYVDTRAAEGESCDQNGNYQCADDLYCASSGVCLGNGACSTVSDCNNADNMWYHPACMGHPTCEQKHCGWNCF